MKTWGLILPIALGAALTCSGAGTLTTLYYTGFEPGEGYNHTLDLAGQQGWVSEGSGGNGLVSGYFAGHGQQAYVGFAPPTGSDDTLSVWKPVNLAPVPPTTPIVQFTVLMAIIDSTDAAPFYDDFRWSVYNTGGDRLFSLDFDNDSFGINYVRDNGAFVPTGKTFSPGLVYALTIRMDFPRNEWSASLSGQTLVNAQPMTSTGLALNFGDVDAVWSIRTPGSPGDNFMVFDEYHVTAESVAPPPPEVQPVGRLEDGQFLLRLFGSSGVTYVLEASADLAQWTPVRTNTAPVDGVIDYIDTTASGAPRRFYRARVATE